MFDRLVVALLLLSLSVSSLAQERPELHVYLNAGCECCKKWVAHMRKAGFIVSAEAVVDMHEVKQSLGVPQHLEACHSAVVRNYVIEGHVPPEDVYRLLQERPRIVGIAVPDMPVGSPGMEQGGAREKFFTYTIEDGGVSHAYAEHN